MKNLLVRTITGLLFVCIIIGSILWNDLSATIVFSIFMFIGLIEFYKLFKKHELINVRWESGFLLGLLIYGLLISVTYDYLPLISISIILPIVFLFALLELWRKKENPLINMSILLFGVVYIVIPFFLIVLINHLENLTSSLNTNKLPLVAGMFILVWSNDTFAYLTGRMIGKTKLFERISPNKTWEGTIGGIVFNILAGYLIAFFTTDTSDTLFWIISAFIIAPCSIVGDLLESLIKRSLKIKDSGSILPGHGGILDRFDAALFAIPFFTAWTFFYMYF